MQKRWVEREISKPENITTLQESLQIDPTLATILVQRGIHTFEEARTFFRPQLAQLNDPFLMRDMDKAVSRIEQAIQNKEKILIYGDYDVDGTTAVSLVYSFLKKYHPAIDFYIPDRYKEGYGISIQGIDYAAQNSFSLIIALDCGIKSNDKVTYAQTLGIDFIICDHHLPDAILPQAVAVLDPKRPDCPYPYKELSGCGIGFKLIQAYAQKNNISFSEVEKLLDLVVVSIAADIVPITGENRVLAWYGLQKINTAPCIGIKYLMELAGKKEKYDISDIVFGIAPRINAAGRIDDAKHAVHLLMTENDIDAQDKSLLINLKNATRKEYDTNITEQALAMIATDPDSARKKATVVFQENWHKGVIGIVASRLTEKYYRPTVVLTQSNGHIAGSARSVAGFDLYEALSSCSDLLEQFGGHKYAAGLTLKPENIHAFQQRFEEVVANTIAEELLIQKITIDADLQLQQINPKFFRILTQFAPFGPQNMMPVFLSKNVHIVHAGIVGNNHLKISIRQNHSPVFEGIGFNLGDYIHKIKKDTMANICYTIEENIWKEKRSVQLNIKDIHIAC